MGHFKDPKKKKAPKSWSLLDIFRNVVPKQGRKTARKWLSKGYGILWDGATVGGNALWVVTTSLLIVWAPLSRAIEVDQGVMIEQMRMRQEQERQQGGALEMPGV